MHKRIGHSRRMQLGIIMNFALTHFILNDNFIVIPRTWLPLEFSYENDWYLQPLAGPVFNLEQKFFKKRNWIQFKYFYMNPVSKSRKERDQTSYSKVSILYVLQVASLSGDSRKKF